MKIKFKSLSLSMFILASCQSTSSITYPVVNQDGMTLFPTQASGNVGDVMPIYHEGEWHFFYLHDSAPNPGFHPWYRMSTTNFTTYTDHGEVIPVVHDLSSQELALGTGSVIEKDYVFYAFYTAHNGRLTPKETIRLSVSTNAMATWNKHSFEIRPQDYGFDLYDFRDPHVVYIPDENQYYMLFTTRYQGLGAIGYLTSTNLLEWNKEGNGIFYLNNRTTGTDSIDANLECPTLWYYQGYWYLSYSDQRPTRQTHYVYKQSWSAPWIRPLMNQFDSKGLYAGKIAISEDQMILGGWVSTDFNRAGEFAWGGSLIAHELKQNGNGTLYVDVVSQINDSLSNPQPIEIIDSTISHASKDAFEFKKTLDQQHVVFDTLYGISRLDGELTISSIDGYFGIMFDYRLGASSYHYDFNIDLKQTRFYKGDFTSRLNNNLYTSNTFIHTGDKLPFTILFENTNDSYGSIVTLYIKGQVAHTARMFRVKTTNIGFYSLNSAVIVSSLTLHR